MTSNVRVSVVTSMFRSSPFLAEFHARTVRAISAITSSLIISIWSLGGLTLFSVGIVGVYLAKVFTEAKTRPYTIIRAEYGTPGR